MLLDQDNKYLVPFIKKTKGGGIKWNAKTIETAQCLGVFLDGEDLIARISNPAAEPGEDIKVAEEIIKGLSGSHDYDSEGVSGIVSVLNNEKLRNPFDLAQTCLLASGMTSFVNSIEWNIWTHYSWIKLEIIIRQNEKIHQIEKTGSKFPTPDMIICNKPASTVISELEKNKVTFTERVKGFVVLKNLILSLF